MKHEDRKKLYCDILTSKPEDLSIEELFNGITHFLIGRLKREDEFHNEERYFAFKDQLFKRIDALRNAAPDMLAALEAVIPEEGHSDWWCPTCKEFVGGWEVTYQEVHEKCGTFLGDINDPEWITKARAAIAKAKGGAK